MGLPVDAATRAPGGRAPEPVPRVLDTADVVRPVALVAFFALAPIFLTWPLAQHVATALVGGDDPFLNSWILAWDVHALTSNPLHLYDANIFFPFPLPLTYSETLLSGAILVAPVLLLTGNPALAHNVLTLFSLGLAGLGTCVLVRELTGHTLAAVAAGCIFAFSPYQQDQLIHVQLLQTGWLALAILFLHRALRYGHGRDFLLFGVFFVCEAWASYYLFFLGSVAIGTFLSVEALTSRVFWRPESLARLMGTFVLVGVCVVPPSLPYLQTQQTFHFHWPLEILRDFSAHPTDYLSVSVQKLLYPPVARQFAYPDFPAEHALFPGLATLALVSLALVALFRPRARVEGPSGARIPGSDKREIGRYLAILLVALVLSFGRWLDVPGRADPLRMPYLSLYRAVPGFSAMRVPARFEFLEILALSVLAGFGIAWLDAVLGRRVSFFMRRAVLGGLAGLLVLDLLPVPRLLTPVASGSTVPPVYAWLRAQNPDAVVAEIPSTPLANFSYVFLSAYHWHPLVNGISGFNPPQFAQISAQLDAFPDQPAVDVLRSLGVQYVIAHRDALDARVRRALDTSDLAQLHLGVAASFGSDVVYALAPLQQIASSQDRARLELPSEIGRGVPAAATLTFTNDTPAPLSLNAVHAIDVEVAANTAARANLRTQMLPGFIRPGDTTTQGIPIGLGSTAPGVDQAQVHVHLTGAFDVETTRLIQFVDLPTSEQKTGLSASVTRAQAQAPVHARSTLQLNFVARNVGRAVWLADTGEGRGAIGVAVRSWNGPDGHAVQVDGVDLGAGAAHLDWNVNPGQEAAFAIVARTPAAPGHYDLVLDMLSESVTWFADVNGGARTVIPVVVDD